MRFAVILLRWVMNFIYFFMKLAPVRENRIVFLSRQADTPSEDFICLKQRILEIRPDAEIFMITQRMDNNLKSMLRFFAATLKSMRYLATSRVCILDAYWPAVSVLRHKEKLAVIQLWHAMGKIKKSGYQSIGKKFGRSDMIAREMRMHRNYDVIIAGGKAFNPFYCAAFGTTEDKLYNVGLPRMDTLRENIEKNRIRFYTEYPWLRGKKIVLYVPTFRKGQILDPKPLVDAFDFDNDQCLVVKRHPNQQIKSGSVRPGLTCSKLPTSVVLSVADAVITDYSAITIEAAVLNKPVYFYLFDYEDYLSHNGLNVNLADEFPDSTFYDAKSLFRAIDEDNYDYENYSRFREKYLPDLSGRATDKIASLVVDCMEKDKHYAIYECITEQNKAGSTVDSESLVRA